MKAIGYIRISKEEEGSVSLDYQKTEIRKLAKAKGYKLIRIEKDNGISGATIAKRPGVQCVLKAVDSQEIDALIVYKSERMSRDGMESLQIEKLLLQRQVKYLSVVEGEINNGSVDDEFMQFIRAGLNQRERKLIAIRTSQALKRKKEKGEHVGRPRYGYRAVSKVLIEDKKEQATIKKILALKDQGASLRGIARKLTEDGVFSRSNKPFAASQIRSILTAA
jgi:site-specific DNA recombinase